MLTDTQNTTLAAHIRASADAEVIAALAIRNDTELARLYNLDSTFIVWREAVQPNEYREVMVWTDVDTMTAGNARIWEWITQNMTIPYNATKANIRAGLDDVWSGTSQANLIAISKEFASIAEEIFTTGTGTDIDPGIRIYVGTITISDIGKALNDNP